MSISYQFGDVDAYGALIRSQAASLEAEHQSIVGRMQRAIFTSIDVLALTGFQFLSRGGLTPLPMMTTLPILVGIDVSSRRAAFVLATSLVGSSSPCLKTQYYWTRWDGVELYFGSCSTDSGVALGPTAPTLSPREREVLTRIARGQNIPTIAAELYVAPSAVKTHVQRLYEKLGVCDPRRPSPIPYAGADLGPLGFHPCVGSA